ncbi:hypothetical protein AGMMS50268_37130 [Spirochaetia bacterium]|nr:hypothetical protein AGMMS50268_37130 [Spirochaetia bacterium]
MNLLGLELPDEMDFKDARDFLHQNLTLSKKELLRLFIKKYGDRINGKAFAYLLPFMFHALKYKGE